MGTQTTVQDLRFVVKAVLISQAYYFISLLQRLSSALASVLASVLALAS